ncbi:hypothetical protein SEA_LEEROYJENKINS_127 [Microbacterium phage LeeroyJenkins]|nr:hypothetical protein SEA_LEEROYJENKINS_1 [Microbacterium phage LeeroyJenkins]QDK01521.1 hypothetical protein SEA_LEEROYJENKINS_127 [Microbacterium phage LeeroyJenkins]QOC59327.1 hypothetical protein SEA_LIFES_1 [Microbacterium phage Lifes]QOC59442.1 hypothetical protein SEA_LIFES_121 [Microbacterium phage Lifes]
MAITLTAEGQFFNTDKGREMGVFAKANRAGRWQYRMGSPAGKLLASGITPAKFVQDFWIRDDFEG